MSTLPFRSQTPCVAGPIHQHAFLTILPSSENNFTNPSVQTLFFTAKLYLFCNINLTVFILYKNVYLKHLWKHHKNQILTCIIVLILVILTQMKAGLEEGSHMRKDALGPKSFISYKRFSHTIKRKPYHPLFL